MEAPCMISELDMGAFTCGDSNSVTPFLHSLRHQCTSVGLFYLKNHGIPQPLCHSILHVSRSFFHLPLQSKLQMDYRNSPQFRGYMMLGCENTNGLTDYREQIEIGPEEQEETDALGNKFVYPLYRRLRGPNLWPSGDVLPEFRPIVEEYMVRMVKLSMKLMEAIALSLGLSKHYFEPLFGSSPHPQLKVLRYPMSRDGNEAEFGVGAHTDSGFLTLLLQDEGTGGLQAKTVEGKWKDVPPKSGTFVVNLGEMLEFITRGCYVATVHRVLNIDSHSARYSVPFFFNPKLDAEIKPMDLEQLKTFPQAAPQFVGSVGAYSTHGGKNKIFPVYGENAFKSFYRSHPEVVKRYHQDCLGNNIPI